MSTQRSRYLVQTLPEWLIGACLVAGPAIAPASNFVVAPVRVELSSVQRSAALTVTNEMKQDPVVVELRAVAWSQTDGQKDGQKLEEDVYAPTNELIATPPLFTMQPGGSQVIRVGLRHPAGADREQAYRLILREVPPPPKPGFAGVQIALEMSLPVFAKPQTSTAPALNWSLETHPDGAIGLVVKNAGTAHVQIADLVLSAPGADQPVGTFPQFAYVLPGMTRHLPLERGHGALPGAGSSLHLTAYSDAGEIDARLPVAPN